MSLLSCASCLLKGDWLQVSIDLNPSTFAHEQGGQARDKSRDKDGQDAVYFLKKVMWHILFIVQYKIFTDECLVFL
jgi:hypothetical protein